MLSPADFAQVPTTRGGASGQMQFVDLDVPPGQIGHAGDGRIVLGDEDGEFPKRSFDAVHGGWPQREADLLDIGAQGGGQSGRNRGPLRFAPAGCVGVQLAWRDVGDAEVEERRFGTEQRGGQRAHAVRVRPMTAETGDERITAGLQLRLRERVGGSTEQGRHFDGRGPLQNCGSPIETERGGGRTETDGEGAMVAGRHLAQIGATEDQILWAGMQLPDDHQPADQAALRQRCGALLRQVQTCPAVDADALEPRSSHRAHRVVGIHAGREQRRSVGLNLRLDLRRACGESPHHWGTATGWASIASNARRYLFKVNRSNFL